MRGCAGRARRQEEAAPSNSSSLAPRPHAAGSVACNCEGAEFPVRAGVSASKPAAAAPEAFPPLGAASQSRRGKARRITPTPSRRDPLPPPVQQHPSAFSAPSWQPQAPAWPASSATDATLSPAMSAVAPFVAASACAPPVTPQGASRPISPFVTTVLVGAPPDELFPASPGLAVSPQITNLERLFSGADVGDRVSPANRRITGHLSFEGPSPVLSAMSRQKTGQQEGQQGLSVRGEQKQPGKVPRPTSGTAQAADAPHPASPTAANPRPSHRIRPQPVQALPPAATLPQWGQVGFRPAPPTPPLPPATSGAAAAISSPPAFFDARPEQPFSIRTSQGSSHTSGSTVQPAAPGGPRVSPEERAQLAGALGRLHGGLLLQGCGVALAPELGLLLRLLALPPACEALGGATPLLSDTRSAIHFASSSLMSAGVLGSSVNPFSWDATKTTIAKIYS